MQSFLEQVCSYLYSSHREILRESVVVFPNKRAGLFFRKYLSEIITEPLVLPEIATINDLLSEISGIQVAENFALVTELFHAYRELVPNAESFDEFYPWGEVLLSDFDDLDKYLVDPAMLFKNIRDLKEIDQLFDFPDEAQKAALAHFWGTVSSSRNSREKTRFLEFWNLLNPLYCKYKERLLQNSIGYEGMVFRMALEIFRKNTTDTAQHARYFFVGLNALNNCEKDFMSQLKKLGKAEFFWDYDRSYLDNKQHEAGYFMRENLKGFPPPVNFILPIYFPAHERTVQVIPVSTHTGQARVAAWYAGQFLKSGTDPLKTAVVFTDEKFLLPVVHALPDNCKEVNITMGYPVEESLSFAFITQLFDLQRNARIIRHEVHFYHKQVLSLLHHPLVWSMDREMIPEMIREIRSGNHVMVPASVLSKSRIAAIFKHPEPNGVSFSSYILQTISILIQPHPTGDESNVNSSFEQEVIVRVFTALQHLDGQLKSKTISIHSDTYIRLVRRMLQLLRVAFSGEPLAGIQLLGLLETRVLDFDQLIVLPCNEGVLPKTSQSPSFVPNNLRYAYGMPTLQHQDAIFAYYFYRLLHRSKQVIVLWNSGQNDASGGRMSRYIYQLLYEGYLPIEQKQFTAHIQTTGNKPYEVLKDETILTELQRYTDKRYLSPSALSDFLSCPLKFYLRHLCRLRPSDELTEDADGGITGSLFHQAAFELYSPLLGKNYTVSSAEEILSTPSVIENAVLTALRKQVYKSIPADKKPELQGPYIILSDVIQKYLRQLVLTDKKVAPFNLLFLEEEFISRLEIQQGNKILQVRIGGKADRVDRRGNRIWIIDYKTGRESSSPGTVEKMFDPALADKVKAEFQATFYAMLLQERVPDEQTVPCLLYVKSLFSEETLAPISIGEGKQKKALESYEEIRIAYEEALSALITRIFNPGEPFIQTTDANRCTHCDFKQICRR